MTVQRSFLLIKFEAIPPPIVHVALLSGSISGLGPPTHSIQIPNRALCYDVNCDEFCLISVLLFRPPIRQFWSRAFSKLGTVVTDPLQLRDLPMYFMRYAFSLMSVHPHFQIAALIAKQYLPSLIAPTGTHLRDGPWLPSNLEYP